MKDYNFKSGNNEKLKPQVSISVTNLDLEIEEGKVFKDSILLQSENQVPLKGMVFSTNDKVGIDKPEISGVKKEIHYYFKGKLAVAGNEFEGDLVILTNGGEFNIPYRIHVIPRSANTSIGRISDMEGFTRLYHASVKEAMELFFHPQFSQVFLKEEPEKQSLYHCLMKSRSKPLILEEFMTGAGYKEPVSLIVDEKSLVLNERDEEESILIKLSGQGYLEGRIYSEHQQLIFSTDRFTANDFEDGCLRISCKRNPRPASGSDVIHISTVRQDITVPAEWWETESRAHGERERIKAVKELRAELMRNYLYFRTASIDFEDFAQEAHRILDDLLYFTGDMVWKLFLAHLLLMEEAVDQVKELMEEIYRYEKESPFEPLAARYLMYLRAMVERTPDAIGEAVTSIRGFYEATDKKAEALWMLIYLDRDYVYNKRLQYDTIKQLFQSGNNSSLLYFEACEILNKNPDFMEEAGLFELAIFRWGLRYGYVSMAMAYQFAGLALKIKYYSRSVFSVARSLYKIEPEEKFLQVICSLLIKGNKTGKEYHEYFHQAVEANLKFVGLNEFFIRSMDYSSYEIIPQRVLIYFTYSNSLDYKEKAYLYSNILNNKAAYEEVYGAYYSKMPQFVEDQLRKGRMNEHLAFLYTQFQKEILENPGNAKAVCDVLFYKGIRCYNPRITGIYICSPETGEEIYYPLSGGYALVQKISDRSVIYFTDVTEQRYVSGIDYKLLPFLSLSQLPQKWVEKNLSNKKILQSLSDKVDGPVSAGDLPVFKKIAFNEDYRPFMRSRAIEKLLKYYGDHQQKEELARWLTRTAYTDISPGFRKQLMDYYMETGMLENAFFGAELYGSLIMGAAKQLRLASFGVQHFESSHSETTLSLAYSAFLNKKYNRDTLGYLMKCFDGELLDLLLIWERASKIKVATADFEKKIIYQSMLTGSHTAGVFPVFESFYNRAPADPLAAEYLAYISALEMQEGVALPDSIHQIIGEEIREGRMSDKRARVNFLYHFADKKDQHENIKEAVRMVIREFLEEDFYLPVYQAYRQIVSLPIDYCERTFITYQGDPGQDITLYYRIEQEEEEVKERHLLEILPGMYVASLHFYQSDHVNYRLEAGDEPVPNEEDIKFEIIEYEGDDSRFFELNHLSAKKEANELYEYLLKAFFVDEYISLL